MSALIATVALILGLSSCGNQKKDFQKQLEQAGFSVSQVREDKSKPKTSKSKKRPKRTTNKVTYEADVKIGNCLVEFEQGKGEKRYYLDEVNDTEPVVSLMIDNPKKADVEAYLKSPDSPCTP
jgi:hypothetical protein